MTPRLEIATKRLQQALVRIEAVLSKGVPDGDDQLRELAEQLAQSRAENQELGAANVSVAQRLDHAIDRLRAVLRT